MHKIIDIAEHASNNDKTAKLVWEDKARHVHAYEVRGGFVACPGFMLALDAIFPTLNDAKAALA